MSSGNRFQRLEIKYRVLLAATAGAVFLASTVAITSGDEKESVASAPTTTAAPRPGVPGFSSIAFSVIPNSGGPALEHCGLLAETDEQLAKGLMNQSDLGGYDAMIFRFPEDVTSPFYMANVPVNIAIAWFKVDGAWVSQSEMEVCREADSKNCPLYKPAGPYRFALETKSNGLADLGVSEGSSLQLGGGC